MPFGEKAETEPFQTILNRASVRDTRTSEDPGHTPAGRFKARSGNGAFARPLEPHQPPRSANRTPLGCRDRKHPPLGCGLVVRHPDMGNLGHTGLMLRPLNRLFWAQS